MAKLRQAAAIDALARMLVEMIVEEKTGRPCPALVPKIPCAEPAKVAL